MDDLLRAIMDDLMRAVVDRILLVSLEECFMLVSRNKHNFDINSMSFQCCQWRNGVDLILILGG